ncbi:hypothetical protein DSL92_01545 [Billgrantia gudaonensis]|uniref:Uncharacterized protein n=1 Tax=Billgrantia gudaonensis TaxID=376427 RepID=A0A3S0R5H9_9GAMM|nr:hypothetical protein DSL92_01545 [Halomonas gudaonensis]
MLAFVFPRRSFAPRCCPPGWRWSAAQRRADRLPGRRHADHRNSGMPLKFRAASPYERCRGFTRGFGAVSTTVPRSSSARPRCWVLPGVATSVLHRRGSTIRCSTAFFLLEADHRRAGTSSGCPSRVHARAEAPLPRILVAGRIHPAQSMQRSTKGDPTQARCLPIHFAAFDAFAVLPHFDALQSCGDAFQGELATLLLGLWPWPAPAASMRDNRPH